MIFKPFIAVAEKNDSELAFWMNSFATEGRKRAAFRKLYIQLYCHYLSVRKTTFKGKILLDVGCGPHGAVGWFDTQLTFGVDPLANRYHLNFDLSKDNVVYLNTGVEKIPLIDSSVDVVISRNAIDHVDSLPSAINEIYRIIKHGGTLLMAVNYQEEQTITEPVVINDHTLKNLLKGKFEYEIIKRFPRDYDSKIGGKGQFKYHHPIVLIKAHKI